MNSKFLSELIVADASSLIVLARIRHLPTLAALAGKVIVPDMVAQECLHDPRLPGAQQIAQALEQGMLSRQPQFPRFEPVAGVGLDPGEAAAIGLAVALGAPILIDERIGRQVAFAHSLKVVGTMGILLRAKERGLVRLIRPLIDSLRDEGFFVAPALVEQVLQRANE